MHRYSLHQHNKYCLNRKTIELFLSDRKDQILWIDEKVKTEDKTFVTKLQINANNIKKFKEFLSDFNWNTIIFDSDGKKSYENFHKTINEYFKLSFPMRKSSVRVLQRKPSNLPTESLGLKKAVEATQTIYNVRKYDISIELLRVLEKYLRNSYTEAKTSKEKTGRVPKYRRRPVPAQQELSTTTAITDLVEGIAEAMENYHDAQILAFDLSKAFDTIVRSLLLKKFEYYEVRGKARHFRVLPMEWETSCYMEKYSIRRVKGRYGRPTRLNT
ncbi:hypothetical protein HHI36_018639 [Cryptolaemus montrouzieri]|uniref:Reverse transcriptase domain-containing protein n=1 Tax=Cryptolaemus montrouzieri TaxID=559131 RepID=A0ABD2P0M1_9CUCU